MSNIFNERSSIKVIFSITEKKCNVRNRHFSSNSSELIFSEKSGVECTMLSLIKKVILCSIVLWGKS